MTEPSRPRADHGPNYLQLLDPMTDEDYEATEQKANQLRHANARLVGELAAVGAEPDFAVSMLTVFFQGLEAVGVLTKAQLLTIQYSWEKHFHDQLMKMHAHVQEQIERQQVQQRLAVPSGGSAKRGLIVPGR